MIFDCNANIGDYYLTLFLQEAPLPVKIHQGIEPTINMINEGSLNVKKKLIFKRIVLSALTNAHSKLDQVY